MKAAFISYNQALTEAIDAVLSHLHIRGYTKWELTTGRGSINGEPHMGNHTWPAMNSSILAIIPDEKVEPLLNTLRKLDAKTEQQGCRAFIWNIENQM